MSPTVGDVAGVLRELAAAGVAIRAEGGNLHLSPKSKIAPQLLDRVRRAKPALLTMLSGDLTPDEEEVLADLPVRDLERVMRARRDFGGVVVKLETPEQRLASAVRQARRRGERLYVDDLRERFQERAAIMQYDGERSRREARRAAAAEVLEAAVTEPATNCN